MSKQKIFRDPIYGYISICEEYCDDFINTSIFQRLRRIEQTSMRVVYPSAHHDRFVHSLGVFYLGQIAFSHIKKSSKDSFTEITEEQWNSFEKTFEIACLMHDCAHSPFSHTFEHYYLEEKGDTVINIIKTFFTEEDKKFSYDWEFSSPQPHEQISALLLLKYFSDKIKNKYSASPQLAARMIMGCTYQNPDCEIRKFENMLIKILNGSAIDVDSLDYIQRDTWASGVSNVQIDYQRLLSSIMIKKDTDDNPQIVFKKGALSVLDNICIGRNFLYKWIFSHHIVNYEQYLITEIIKKINGDSNNELRNNLFSVNAFNEKVDFAGNSYFLPTDDDLMHIIKCHHEPNTLIDEFLSRKYKYKALWKTYFEFDELYFDNISSANRMNIRNQIKEKLKRIDLTDTDFLCLDVKPKLKGIQTNDYFIYIDGKLIDAAKATSQPTQNLNYFILYVSQSIQKKVEIMQCLRSQ